MVPFLQVDMPSLSSFHPPKNFIQVQLECGQCFVLDALETISHGLIFE